MGISARVCKLTIGLLFVGMSCSPPQTGINESTPIDDHQRPSEARSTGCPPHTHVCVPHHQCIDGEINTSGIGLIHVRRRPTTECNPPGHPGIPGTCCREPGTLTPKSQIQTCQEGFVCIKREQCSADGKVKTDGAGLFDIRTHFVFKSCYLHVGSPETGVCCQPPLTPLDICYGKQVCLPKGRCTTYIAGLSSGVDIHSECYINEATYQTGICCDPLPTLDPCFGKQVCVPKTDCSTFTSRKSDRSYNYNKCYIDEATYQTGICCDPSIKIIDICPRNSVCLPEALCNGDILDHTNNYINNRNGGTWSPCALSRDFKNHGVCCRHVVIDPIYKSAKKCGIRNYSKDARSHGKLQINEAQFGEFPWQALLFFTNYTFKCGASLITDQWLLTAAHCVEGYQHWNFKIRLGEWQVDVYDEPLPYVDVDIVSIIVHPDFNTKNLHNDIAVIKLISPIELQYHINRVCLPSTNQPIQLGTRCYATGWGKNAFEGDYQAILKKVTLPFVDYRRCQRLLRRTRLGNFFDLHESFMCAGGELNQGACTGDGGGPLVCKDPITGAYFIRGITAWGINCGQKDVPGVYADVQYFADWIEETINRY